MSAALKAVEAEGLSRIVIYPNSDRGHTGIVEAIEAHRARAANGAVRVFRSLDHDAYLRLLIAADVLVGNSSSGIIEAATAGTASVNIGPRQEGRERSGRSVVDAEESVGSIRDALRQALRKRPIIGRATVYGDGQAGTRIANILASVPLDDTFRRKTGTPPFRA
jgi:UDP-N-acetylglucosamine 2-epimerase